jgi:hypothetical protein
MAETLVLCEFKRNMISFFDELISILPTEPDLVIMRIFLKDQIPIKDVMDIFNFNLNKDDNQLRKMAKERNSNFFLENDPFGLVDAQKSTANHLREIWRSPILEDADREAIWSWIDAFVYLSDKYAKAMGIHEI